MDRSVASQTNRTSAGGTPVRWGRMLALPLILAAVLVAATAPAEARLGDYRCNDPGRVYHGNPRLIRRPAVISADRVYRHIPEYREIIDKGLTDKDVRYHFLMKKASERFAKAVKAMAQALDHDFVAEEGAVIVVRKGAEPPPRRTDEVIARLG